MVDSKRRELYISLGAFIENLTLAAENMGYQTTINIITDQFQKRSLVAEIHLDKAPTTGYDLRIIEKRMTLRTPFKTNSIKENDIKELLSSDPQSIRFFSSSSREGSFIAQKTIEAYEQQAFNKAVQNELATWIRFSDEDVKEKKDGLTTAGMQINGFRGFIVRHFLKPEDSKRESFIKGGIKKTKDQVHYCGGWIIIITHGNSVANWIKAGRLYQHINLTCTQLKIGFQPMNQIIEEDNFKKEVAEYFGVKEEIVFLARIGYVSNIPEPVSPRRPVEAFAQFNK
jgi:nitroreductase